jgi:hypothetical protein
MSTMPLTAADASPGEADLTRGEQGVLRTLIYYHIFDFPLTMDELVQLAAAPWSDQDGCGEAVRRLVDRGLVSRRDDLVHLGSADSVDRRRRAEVAGKQILPRAHRRARFIAAFPWVRAVAISGTLSKGIHQAGDDVDFFVITAPGRPWLCRVVLMGFKKLFLFNSRRLFCVNYLVAEDHLEVPDRNEFTAAEIAWLRPVTGERLLAAFERANGWVRRFLPNRPDPPISTADDRRPAVVSRAVETLLANPLGDALEATAHRMMRWRNRRRYGGGLLERYDQAMRATTSHSKHHPQDFQGKVMKRYTEALAAFEREHGVKLGGVLE